MLWKIILSAFLLIFSFPNFNFNFLAFFGFVPLFFAIENKSPKKAFLISYITGFIFYIGVLYWLYHVTVIGLVIICLYLAIYFGIFGMAVSRFGVLVAPITWIILEYIQAHLPIMGFGWALLGYSQYKNLLLIQIADFSGVYGVSFVVMMVNVTAWKLIVAVTESRKKNMRSMLYILCSMVLVLALVYGYSFVRLSEKDNFKNATKVSVIQGNVPQELKWDPDAQNMIIEKYSALTKMAALDSPDLIVWPETSFPGFFEIDKDMTGRVLNLAKETKTQLLAGVNAENNEKYFNSAAFISREGNIIDRYDKIHLVPFGEYVPFSNKFPALHKLVLGELGEFTPGKEFKIFKLQAAGGRPQVEFGTLICFEDIFPELAKKFVKNGAKFLVVITNDAWYGKSGAAYQHAACSVFRAIENRVPIVRSANTGYSCFIDSRGRIYDSVEEKKSHLFITGYKTSIIGIK
ncbi:MAG: apolipoprotein N-acyltransferase [Candidatus Omnitrophica bacterium]|nr:apolipoprotein N-acyltransferase [Candidatus Omnitrophota bacterium]